MTHPLSEKLRYAYANGALCKSAADELDRQEAEIATLTAEIARRDAVAAAAWGDQRDEYSDAITAAHPANSKSSETFDTAMKMIGTRHGKYELVGLVNWLLVDKATLTAECERLRDILIRAHEPAETAKGYPTVQSDAVWHFVRQALGETPND